MNGGIKGVGKEFAYHMRRHPTEKMRSPDMNVTRKPHLRRIQPDIVGGQRKYAPK
jgi:hypothetical protein